MDDDKQKPVKYDTRVWRETWSEAKRWLLPHGFLGCLYRLAIWVSTTIVVFILGGGDIVECWNLVFYPIITGGAGIIVLLIVIWAITPRRVYNEDQLRIATMRCELDALRTSECNSIDVLQAFTCELERLAKHPTHSSVYTECGQIILQARAHRLLHEPTYAAVVNKIITAENNDHPWQSGGRNRAPGGVFRAFIYGMQALDPQCTKDTEGYDEQRYGISKLKSLIENRVNELAQRCGGASSTIHNPD